MSGVAGGDQIATTEGGTAIERRRRQQPPGQIKDDAVTPAAANNAFDQGLGQCMASATRAKFLPLAPLGQRQFDIKTGSHIPHP